jgi:peptidoglycan/LPS O-acetylase OafA/YrhL
MLGSFRFFLALCVLIFHLSGAVHNLGQFAVVCFYVISGYLITLILRETYHFNLSTFAENRFLRLYPTYYAFTLATLGIWLVAPSMRAFHACWQPRIDLSTYVGNLLIFPWVAWRDMPGNFHFRLLPSTWSVAVELICYALLWLFIARSWKFAVVSMLIAIAWYVYVGLAPLDPGERYFPVIGALLPFSIGSLTYYAANVVARKWSRDSTRSGWQYTCLSIGLIAFLLNWKASLTDPTGTSNINYYLDMVLAACMCIAFHRIRSSGRPGWWDKWLGDLSYPVFLCQYPAGFLAWICLGKPSEVRGFDIAYVAAVISILASIACVLAVDRPIAKMRAKIRTRATTIEADGNP